MAAALTIVLTRGSGQSVAVVANSVAVIDSQKNTLVGDVPVGSAPIAVASGEGGIWVCRAGGWVTRIDPRTRAVVARVDVGTDCKDIAVGLGSVWVAGGDDERVVRIDPELNQIRDVVPGVGSAGSAEPVLWVAAEAGSVWATQGDRLLRIDPRTNQRVRVISIPPAAGLAAGTTTTWVLTQPDDNRLLQFGRSGRARYPATPVPPNSTSPAAASNAVWLVAYEDVGEGLGEVRRYTTSGARNFSLATGRFPLDVAVGDGAAWVVNVEGTVTRFDDALTSVVKRIDTAPTARSSIAVGYGDVWVAIQQPS